MRNTVHLSKKNEVDNAKIFPQRLMEILSEPSNNDAITWLPHGKAFIIINHEKLLNTVLPKYFRKTKYTSFTRKLNRWNFTRVTARGSEFRSYYHDFFQRDNSALCAQMYCKNDRAIFALSNTDVINEKENGFSFGNTMMNKSPQPQIIPSLQLDSHMASTALLPSVFQQPLTLLTNPKFQTRGNLLDQNTQTHKDSFNSSLIEIGICAMQPQSQFFTQQQMSPQIALLQMQVLAIQARKAHLRKEESNPRTYRPSASAA